MTYFSLVLKGTQGIQGSAGASGRFPLIDRLRNTLLTTIRAIWYGNRYYILLHLADTNFLKALLGHKDWQVLLVSDRSMFPEVMLISSRTNGKILTSSTTEGY